MGDNDEDEQKDAIKVKDLGLDYVKQVHQWMHAQVLTNLRLVESNSLVLPSDVVQEIQDEIQKSYQQKRYRKNNVIRLEKIPLHQIYAADPSVPWTPTPRRLWKLGDRCASLRSDVAP